MTVFYLVSHFVLYILPSHPLPSNRPCSKLKFILPQFVSTSLDELLADWKETLVSELESTGKVSECAVGHID